MSDQLYADTLRDLEKAIAERNDALQLARELRDALALIVSDLPRNRDWLNPDTEKIAKVILIEANKQLCN